jgi:hypothetical protein
MNDVLFEDYSDALTIEADIVEREREKSFNRYFENNEYLHKIYAKALQQHFEKLKEQWLLDTRFNSNNFLSTQHSTYLKIVSLGESVVPFMLNDLIKNKTHWFMALSTLTGSNPIQEQNSGKVNEMIGDWVKWGKQNGMI